MVDKVEHIVYLMPIIVGCLEGSFMKVDIAGEVKKKIGDFRCWIESDSWRVSFYFRSLYIADILWNYIQASLGSI